MTSRRQIQSWSREADQQVRGDRLWAVLSRMAAAAVATSSSTAASTTSSSTAAGEAPFLMETLRDRNAAAAAAAAWMFFNERSGSCSSAGIMVQPSCSESCCSPARPEEEEEEEEELKGDGRRRSRERVRMRGRARRRACVHVPGLDWEALFVCLEAPVTVNATWYLHVGAACDRQEGLRGKGREGGEGRAADK